MTSNAPVSAIIVTRDPNPVHVGSTLRSLADQERPPAEVLVVDSTPGGHFLNVDSECALCTQYVEGALERVGEAGSKTKRVYSETAGVGEARHLGIQESGQPAVWHLDEDSVIATPEWTRRALKRIDNPDVAAVGGNVAPIRDNLDGRALGALDAATQFNPGGWYLTHPRAYCTGDACVWPGQDRGEDRTLREELRQHGALVRDPELLAEKDLPTTRQRSLRNVVAGTAGGAIAGAVASRALDAFTGRVL